MGVICTNVHCDPCPQGRQGSRYTVVWGTFNLSPREPECPPVLDSELGVLCDSRQIV